MKSNEKDPYGRLADRDKRKRAAIVSFVKDLAEQMDEEQRNEQFLRVAFSMNEVLGFLTGKHEKRNIKTALFRYFEDMQNIPR